MINRLRDIIRKWRLISDRKLRHEFANAWHFERLLRDHDPVFSEVKGIRGDPSRNPFMMATVWFLRDKLTHSLRVLEIGSFIGSSVLTWDEAIDTFLGGDGAITVVDPMAPFLDEEIYKMGGIGALSKVWEMDYLFRGDFAYKLLRHNLRFVRCRGGVQHLRCNSHDILPLFKDNAFDIIYIDGNHEYDYIKKDIRLSKTLVADGGIICGDDLELQFDEINKDNAIKNKDIDFIEDTKTRIRFHPGVTLAVGEELGRVSSWEGYWAMRKKGSKWETISFEGAPLNIPSHFPLKLRKAVEKRLMKKWPPLSTTPRS